MKVSAKINNGIIFDVINIKLSLYFLESYKLIPTRFESIYEIIKYYRIKGDYIELWEGRDYLNQMGPMKAALLMAHGFNDWNVMPEHSYRIYKKAMEMGIPTQIYYHQDKLAQHCLHKNVFH